MEKVILPAFRSNVREVPDGITKPGWHLPLYRITSDGIDLDFGPLLLFDRAIVDKNNYEFITYSDKRYLKPIKESLRVLREEGFLEILDFKPYLTTSQNESIHQVEEAVYDPRIWTPGILRSLKGWEHQLPSLRNVIGKDYDPKSLHLEFGLYVYLMKKDNRIILTEEERLMRLMSGVNKNGSPKRKWSLKDMDELRDIVKPTVSYLYTNIGISEQLKAPFVDVDFSSELYNMVYMKSMRHLNPDVSLTTSRIEVATKLFNVAIHHLRPKNPLQMMRILKDKRISEFRNYISLVAKNGFDIDANTMNELLIEVIKAQQEMQRKQQKLKWAVRMISLFQPLAPLGYWVEDQSTSNLQKNTKKNYNWLYALIDNSGDNDD